jgi:sec-independent protein translocase protein TatA
MLNSPVDIAIVAAVALLVFGPKKLPELGKALGQGIGNFKKGLQEAQDEVKNALKSDDKSTGSKGEGETEPAAVKDA